MRRTLFLLGLLCPVVTAPPTVAQDASRAVHATAPLPSRIVLERNAVDWCFDEVRGRVDLTGSLRQRVGLAVSLQARPDEAVDLPGRVVAHPWASFTIRGLHPAETPPRTSPPAIRVDITAEANGGTATGTLTIDAGPRAREACREKLRRAERAGIEVELR